MSGSQDRPAGASTGPDPRPDTDRVHVFGIRHHGPGCARTLLRALDALQPAAVALEMPTDAGPALAHVLGRGARHAPQLTPPVALVLHPLDAPERSAILPFAAFSPEWIALRWAARRGVPVAPMDLAHGYRGTRRGGKAPPRARGRARAAERDPLGVLARVSGEADDALWWERWVEEQGFGDSAPLEAFEAVGEAMAAVRATARPAAGREALREAVMRETLRGLEADGTMTGRPIAAVCGAWHAPALTGEETRAAFAADDRRLVQGMRVDPVHATWVPWSWDRLRTASGYGAGVDHPAWYAHVFETSGDAEARASRAARWLARAARLVRAAGLDVSPAHAIAAERLATALGALRGRREPGLDELVDAVRAVFAEGEGRADGAVEAVVSALGHGDRLGAVPDDVPTVPLAADLHRLARRARLKLEAEPRELSLDLRTPSGQARSELLHRLSLLEVPWGRPRVAPGGALGTFKEPWVLVWRPELGVALVEASRWGVSVADAAEARAIHAADTLEGLDALGAHVAATLAAALPVATSAALQRLDRLAAGAADLADLAAAAWPLTRLLRDGDARGTAPAVVAPVLATLVRRIAAGLPAAARGLGTEAAWRLARAVDRLALELDGLAGDGTETAAHGAASLSAALEASFEAVAADPTASPVLRGRAARRLVERGRADTERLGVWARDAFAPGGAAHDAASWLEGLVRGRGLLLLHVEALWTTLDGWLADLDEEAFLTVLPIVRRAFAEFDADERRAMSRVVRALGADDAPGSAAGAGGGARAEAVSRRPLDQERADAATATVLGWAGAAPEETAR